MLSLYIDEDTQQGHLVEALISAGFDCLTVNQAGMRSRSDEEHLTRATALGRITVSRNVSDFQRLHYEWLVSGRTHAGIVVISPQRASIGVQVSCMEQIAQRYGQQAMVDRLEYLLNYR